MGNGWVKEGAECPYCGYIESDADTGGFYTEHVESDGETDCSSCGKRFKFEVTFTIYIRTVPIDGKDELEKNSSPE